MLDDRSRAPSHRLRRTRKTDRKQWRTPNRVRVETTYPAAGGPTRGGSSRWRVAEPLDFERGSSLGTAHGTATFSVAPAPAGALDSPAEKLSGSAAERRGRIDGRAASNHGCCGSASGLDSAGASGCPLLPHARSGGSRVPRGPDRVSARRDGRGSRSSGPLATPPGLPPRRGGRRFAICPPSPRAAPSRAPWDGAGS
jgi:hypothetical protein